jgi:GTP:adenosylcobinamide-phosphate guanylyltransferase
MLPQNNPINSYDALVLAGGKLDKFTGLAHLGSKAWIPIADKPMINYVLEVLNSCPSVNKVLVIGSDKKAPNYLIGEEQYLFSQGTIVEKISLAIEVLGYQGKLLIVSCDIPMVTAEAIEDFLKKCSEVEAVYHYPIVSAQSIKKKFPTAKYTSMTLKEGKFTGGNVHLIDKQAFLESKPLAEQLLRLRKSPFRLISLLGVGFLLNWFFHRLSVSDIEAKGSKLVGNTVAAIVSQYPEIGIDVDNDSSLKLAEEFLQSHSS